MDEIKKTTIRFNLENEFDKAIWNEIQKTSEKKKNSYIKFLIWTGLHQNEQKDVLEEILEIKKILTEGAFQTSSSEGHKKIMHEEEKQAQEPVIEDKSEEQEMDMKIDEDVLNFLDNL